MLSVKLKGRWVWQLYHSAHSFKPLDYCHSFNPRKTSARWRKTHFKTTIFNLRRPFSTSWLHYRMTPLTNVRCDDIWAHSNRMRLSCHVVSLILPLTKRHSPEYSDNRLKTMYVGLSRPRYSCRVRRTFIAWWSYEAYKIAALPCIFLGFYLLFR